MRIRNLRKAVFFPYQLFRRHMGKNKLAQLTSHNHPKIKAIGEALSETLTNTNSVEEQELITQIENRRSVLLNSERKIDVIDYGAGKPDSNRTWKEMTEGIKSKATVSEICKASKSAFWAMILFKLIRKLNPLSCVELGSCVGISASYQAAALNLNGRGHLKTIEGSPDIAQIAIETFDDLNLHNVTIVTGPFQKALHDVLESSKPIDFFFNDGHHDHDAVLNYFNQAFPNFSNEAIIVFDDISWSEGMRNAWKKIEEDERVAASIDLKTIGIVLVSKNYTTKFKFKIPLY